VSNRCQSRFSAIVKRRRLNGARSWRMGMEETSPHAVVDARGLLTDLRQSTGHAVSDTVDTLILDLLAWIGPEPRPYAEVLEAWRTSCPRMPVWEDANDRGFIVRHRAPGRGVLVSVSAAGAEHLRTHRRPSPL
jgi:hypothetical protein